MKNFAHRGLWDIKEEENTLEAMEAAFEAGFDLETDVRFQNGKFLIKHDLPQKGENLFRLEKVLNILSNYPEREVAFHFKYDDWKKGGALRISEILRPFQDRTFLFDMSHDFCKALKDKNSNIKTSVSCGDNHYHDGFCELEEALESEDIDIIWADEYRNFYSPELFQKAKEKKKTVYCVSPDLAKPVGHPRAKKGYEKTWGDLIKWGADGICTDYPKELRKFSNGQTLVTARI